MQRARGGGAYNRSVRTALVLACIPCALVALAVLEAAPLAQAPTGPDPFAFFRPMVSLSAGERARMETGEAVVRIVPSHDRDIAIVSAARIAVNGQRLAAWVHRIAEFKKSPYVLAVRRFSTVPHLADLEDLTLDEEDLGALRTCQPGDCGVKLSEHEIVTMRSAIAAAKTGWKPAAQEAFRRLLLARAQAYLGGGHDALAPYHDQRPPVSLAAELDGLIARSSFLTEQAPRLADHLKRYPHAVPPEVESFLYWSKEKLGNKPTVTITHVNLVRENDGFTLVAATQVYASHYMTGSLAVTAITAGGPDVPRYLVYLNRSRVDLLSGMLGGLVRRIVERRLRGEADDVVHGLRRRLESGEPPDANAG